MSPTNIQMEKAYKTAGGWTRFYRHDSEVTGTEMRFSVFEPPGTAAAPVLYWLSGLTCTEENFMIKAGAQRLAAEHGLMLVAPDTSPRGLDLPGEHHSWDFGSGAGFYVNATREPWSAHYRMYDYVVEELPALVTRHFPVAEGRAGIFGHSMGGHGALVIGLRNPDRYASISAFAPICAPSRCPWGEKAFGNYLGPDRQAWLRYDACGLLEQLERAPRLLIDQGGADNFLEEQLKPQLLEEVCRRKGHELQLRIQPGYDHSYYFIASFMEDHLAHHARSLKAG